MIVTLDKVKTYLKINNTDFDTLITELIPVVESHFETIRNAPFDTDDSDNIIYPKGSEIIAALMVGYMMDANITSKGFTSEGIGDYSYSKQKELIGGYPEYITAGIRRYVGVK